MELTPNTAPLTQPELDIFPTQSGNSSVQSPGTEMSHTTNTSTASIHTNASSRLTSNINQITPDFFNSVLDDVRYKQEGDYRIILQNTNGIKEFRDNDPDYLPTIRALQLAGADHISLVETNTPWHANDFLYDLTMVHRHVWKTPTKTVGASCRTEKLKSTSYQPGGVLSITANTLTTKINTVETDKLGRWAKTNFFAKDGNFIIYTIYRPNPGSLRMAGVNSPWMQQYRALSKKAKDVDPRSQLIEDLIVDIRREQALNSKKLLAGDFNEDLSENLWNHVLSQMFSKQQRIIPPAHAITDGLLIIFSYHRR